MKLRAQEVSDVTARQMLAQAKAAVARTYPVPGKGYAATALGASGRLYDGVSYCSDTQTLTMHCEMTALANAAIQGETTIVAITGPNCHMCKQFLWESSLRSGYDIHIIMEERGKLRRVLLSALMPYSWPG